MLAATSRNENTKNKKKKKKEKVLVEKMQIQSNGVKKKTLIYLVNTWTSLCPLVIITDILIVVANPISTAILIISLLILIIALLHLNESNRIESN